MVKKPFHGGSDRLFKFGLLFAHENKICFDQQNFIFAENQEGKNMYWTLELASYLEDAPWPATKDELIDYSIRSGAPL